MTSADSWISGWQEPFLEESIERFALKIGDICKYGISCLDDAMGGIYKNDLIVIGADSGCGKSELVLNIARHNAQRGKRVVLYYLEGGHIEAIRRMKWRDVVELYFEKYRHYQLQMDYSKWVSNSIEDPKGILEKIDKEVFDRYSELYKNNLKICQIQRDFSLSDLLSSIMDFYNYDIGADNMLRPKMEADLLLIDHLQYFSLPDNETEIASITKILRECKHLTDRYKIPIVLVSHLRKKSKDRGVPDQEDFYGSSNIPKISTTSILISPDYEGEDRAKDRYPTFFRFAKSRVGVRPNIVARAVFNLNMRKYEEHYQLFQLDQFSKPKSEPIIDSEKPLWARKYANPLD